MGMYVCACLFMYVYAYMFVCTCGCLARIYIYLYVRLRASVFRVRLVRSGPVAEDSDPIRIRVVLDPTHRRFEDLSLIHI